MLPMVMEMQMQMVASLTQNYNISIMSSGNSDNLLCLRTKLQKYQIPVVAGLTQVSV